MAFNLDVTKFVPVTFFHHIGDDEVLLIRRQFGDRRNNAEIGIALRQVKLAKLLLVKCQTIGIIAGAGAEKAIETGLLRHHFAAQLAIGELFVADNVDLLNLRLGPFGNLENNVYAVLVELNQFRLNDRRKAPLTLVKFNDARDIGAHFGSRINLARRKFDFGFNFVILDTLVAFKNDAVHHRVFAHLNYNRAGVIANRDICEQFGRIQVLQRLVSRDLRPWLSCAQTDI